MHSIGLALSSACLDAMYLVVLRVHSKYSPGLARDHEYVEGCGTTQKRVSWYSVQ